MTIIPTIGSIPILTFVTTTSYGSWLPGDARGYVERGQFLPPNPALQQFARSLMSGDAVTFSAAEQARLLAAFLLACDEFDYRALDLTIEAWHLHWIVRHTDHPKVMVGRLKTRMRQSLGRGRIWTEGYCHNVLESDDDLFATRDYIRKHPGCRLIDGMPYGSEADKEPPAMPGREC